MCSKSLRIVGVAVIAIILSLTEALASELRDSLEHALSNGDIKEISAIAHEHGATQDQNEIFSWIREKVDSGKAPDTFAQMVVLASYRAGNTDEALTYLSYYRTLIMIDSVTCKDPSSGGSLLEATIFFHQRILDRKEQTTVDQKKDAIDRAIKLEEATSKVRRKDPALCGSGLGGYAKALNVPLEPSGALGHDTSDTKFTKKRLYADDPLWRQKRKEQLPNLRKSLLLLSDIKDGQ